MVFGGNFLNHTLASPFSVVENALHIISSETPWMHSRLECGNVIARIMRPTI